MYFFSFLWALKVQRRDGRESYFTYEPMLAFPASQWSHLTGNCSLCEWRNFLLVKIQISSS